MPAAAFALHQNYPNPFNPSTMIRYSVPDRGQVSLDIFDVSGKRVRSLVGGERRAGEHVVAWDGRDTNGIPMSSGVYFYRLKTGKIETARKMILGR